MGGRLRPFGAALALVVVAAAISVGQLAPGERDEASRDADGGSSGAPSQPAGSHARFQYLASERTNRCDLEPAEVRTNSPNQRLEGACCSSMDERHYRRQVAALQNEATLVQIPRDPYDVSVALARRLLRYDRTIQLTPTERATYQRAMRASPEHGPCCCRCWRWDGFRGLAKDLIHEHDWPAARVGRLIGNLDGCGGTDDDEHA